MSSPPIPANIASYTDTLSATVMSTYLTAIEAVYLADPPTYYNVRPATASQAKLNALNIYEPPLPGVSTNSYTQTLTNGDNSYTVSFDVYSPVLSDLLGPTPKPWIFYLHGGGWLYDENYDYNIFLCEIVLEHNVNVVYVHYGLTASTTGPATVYPGQINECNLLLTYLLANASTYGLNSTVMIMGDSAGANLAYHCAVANPGIIKALIMVSPCLDPTMSTYSWIQEANNIWLPAEAMAWFWSLYEQTPGVTTPSSALTIPTFLVISELDVLRDEAVIFATDASNVTGVIYNGMNHDFFIAPGLVCPATLDFSSRVNAFIGANI